MEKMDLKMLILTSIWFYSFPYKYDPISKSLVFSKSICYFLTAVYTSLSLLLVILLMLYTLVFSHLLKFSTHVIVFIYIISLVITFIKLIYVKLHQKSYVKFYNLLIFLQKSLKPHSSSFFKKAYYGLSFISSIIFCICIGFFLINTLDSVFAIIITSSLIFPCFINSLEMFVFAESMNTLSDFFENMRPANCKNIKLKFLKRHMISHDSDEQQFVTINVITKLALSRMENLLTIIEELQNELMNLTRPSMFGLLILSLINMTMHLFHFLEDVVDSGNINQIIEIRTLSLTMSLAGFFNFIIPLIAANASADRYNNEVMLTL